VSFIEIDTSEIARMAELYDADKVREAAGAGFERGVARLAAYIQQEKLSGQVLNQRSGRLSQAVGHPTVETSSNTMTATIGGPFYGGVQEFGATINSPVLIEGVGWRYIKELQPRPWLYPSVEERMDDITQQMREAVTQSLNE
jgi:hypothetical protein